MKKTFLLGIFAIISLTATAQWVNIQPPAAKKLSDLAVTSNQHAMVLSSDSIPAFYKTTDGGQTWATHPMPTFLGTDPYYWQGIQFLDEQTGFIHGSWLVGGGLYAGGTESFIVYRTTDGGQTWKDIIPPVPTHGFEVINKLHFFNTQQAVVTLTTGKGYQLLKTTDDGGFSWVTRDTFRNWDNTWSLRPDGTGYAIRYNHYAITTDPEYMLYQVSDFGNTFTYIGGAGQTADWPNQRIGMFWDSLLYIDQNVAYRLRRNLGGLGPADDQSFLDRSTDGGNTWEQGYFEHPYLTPYTPIRDTGGAVWILTFDGLFRQSLTNATTEPQNQDGRAYPSPLRKGHALQLALKDIQDGPAQVQVWSTGAQLMWSGQVVFTQGKGSLTSVFEMAGIYTIQIIKRDGQQWTQKVMVTD